MKPMWAIGMGPLWNPWTIPYRAHFSAHVKPTWAQHINVSWVKAGTEMGLAHVSQLGPTKWQVQSHIESMWAIGMGPLWNPWTIPYRAHFSAHVKPTWAPQSNVSWVKAGTKMGLVNVAQLGPTFMGGGGLRQMRVRVRGRGVRGRGVRVRGGGVVGRAQVSDEIRATVIDHIINHGLSLREAGQRIRPVLNRNTVASIGSSDCRSGHIRNINNVSLTTIDRILRRNHMAMKQLYRVPFQRNSDVVKEARCQYVERIMELKVEGAHHVFIYVDEASFNLSKVRRRGRNLIGYRATITVPGQRGANITTCAGISNDGVLCRIPAIGLNNTERLITFLNALHERLIPPEERRLLRPGMPLFIIIWDNVAFHHSRLVNEWFGVHPRMMMLFLPAYSTFLNPIEEFFSAWRWNVYDHHPYEQMPLLNECNDCCCPRNGCRGMSRLDKARRFFPRGIARKDIECDVDEAMWPHRQDRRD
ncbi:Insertion element IS630 uncharacterized 39 kDa protein [Labeo rohita]|uniref:Insertion element IS630 uncharacterized 39 kDa protein n=1 Tax=Labeo rohita TaxID=84645 RepID=A0ABQ8L559_LABRO|nr:Insertion element IS630 uncharacterized 39 kDa protein [Labeo rohita]